MVMVSSTMLPLGSKAPDFNLPDVVSGKTISLSDFKDKKGLLVMFLSVHCPFVKHIRQELSRLAKDYAGRDIGIVAITSNDVENYPDDSPANSKIMAEELGFTFPYCFDETQEVAKTYTAACTPDFFLFGKDLKLVYRGQLDESRPESGKPVTGKDLRTALDAILNNQAIASLQRPSLGCNIKWKKGNQPSYFHIKA